MDLICYAPLAFDPILAAFPTPVPTPTPSPPTPNPLPPPPPRPQSQPPWPQSQPPATILAPVILPPPMPLDPFPAPAAVTVVNVQAMPAGGIYYAVPNDRGSIRQGSKTRGISGISMYSTNRL